MTLLIRDVEVHLGGGRAAHRVDVRVAGTRVVAVAPGLARAPGEEVLAGRGCALLPGLTDHHLHLHALAATLSSVRCGPPAVTDRAGLTASLTAAPTDPHGWVRAVGYTETVAGDLDATALDRLHPHRPVRIQHRSGALWMVNSAAVTALHLTGSAHPGVERAPDGRPTGRIWRADDWLRSRLPPSAPRSPPTAAPPTDGHTRSNT